MEQGAAAREAGPPAAKGPDGRPGPPVRFLLGEIWRMRLRAGTVMLLGVGASLSQVAVLAMTKPLIDLLTVRDGATMIAGLSSWLGPEPARRLAGFLDRRILADRAQGLELIAGIFAVVAVASLGFGAIHRYKSRMLALRFQMDLLERLYARVLALSVGALQRKRQGDVMSRFSMDVRGLQDAICDVFQVLVKEPFTVCAALAASLFINWRVAVVAVIAFPLVGLVITLLNRRVRTLALRESRILGGLLHQVGETIGGILMVKIFRSESLLLASLRAGCRECLGVLRKITFIEAATPSVVDFLGYMSFLGIVFWFAPDVFAGRITAGDLAGLGFLLGNIYRPVKALSNASQKIARSLASAERYLEILGERQEPEGGALPFPRQFDRIELRDLRFRYPEGAEALGGISAEIRRGQTVAVVGPTGSGKTTLLHLLPALYGYPEGMILLDGAPLQRFSTASLRTRMALVSQHVFLFHDTIRRNIALDGGTDQAAVEAAARAACAHEFIAALPSGYDTVVGDQGVLLSGGQRQRIALARAILRNPDILLLDEATSALDTETERRVQREIESLSRGRTTIVVAHRLSTVQHADRILVLDRGRLVEQGTHAELLARGGLYARLWEGDDRDGGAGA